MPCAGIVLLLVKKMGTRVFGWVDFELWHLGRPVFLVPSPSLEGYKGIIMTSLLPRRHLILLGPWVCPRCEHLCVIHICFGSFTLFLSRCCINSPIYSGESEFILKLNITTVRNALAMMLIFEMCDLDLQIVLSLVPVWAKHGYTKESWNKAFVCANYAITSPFKGIKTKKCNTSICLDRCCMLWLKTSSLL